MSTPKTALATLFSHVLERGMGLPPAHTRDIAVTRNLRVPMRDDVTLLADRYIPTDGDARSEAKLPTCSCARPMAREVSTRRSTGSMKTL